MANPNAVLIDNVDDYLAPSQACINPLYNSSGDANANANQNDEKKEEKPEQNTSNSVVVPKARKRRPRVTPNNNNGQGPAIPSIKDEPKKQQDPIKASMADCLACSGCVTTAETVLLEQNHSLTALKNAMESVQHKTLVATISPAVWADMMRHLQVPQSEKQLWQQKLVTALQRVLNVTYVMDGNLPLQWSLLEAGEEFCRAYQAKYNQDQQNDKSEIQELDEKETPSVAINAMEAQYMLPDGTTKLVNTRETPPELPHLPILTGSCPAVVCLVEKSTHPAVRHLSKAKSPMSMAGAWWRHQSNSNSSAHGSGVFHLAVMPCHDKKLEASRKDFADSSLNQQLQDVDMVLTTQEWLQMMADFVQGGGGGGGEDSDERSKEENTQKVREYIASLPPAPAFTGLENLLQNSSAYKQNGEARLLLSQANDADGESMELEETKNADESMDMEVENIPNTKNNNGSATFTPYGSGGLAEFVFRYAAWRLFDHRVDEVTWKPVIDRSIKAASARMQRVARNRDYYQAALYRHTSGEISTEECEGSTLVMKFGIAYGLQTVQRVLEPFNKSNKTHINKASNGRPFDFIEAMACPSGCLNGGGQLRVADRETPTQTRERVSSTRDYFTALPMTENMQQALPQELRQTRFHVVPPLVFSMGAVKGVDVKDTQW